MPDVDQQNPPSPPLYQLEGPFGEAGNEWDLTVWSVRPSEPEICANLCPRTTFTVTRGFPTETVIIRKLTIIRPLGVDESVIVNLGNFLSGSEQDKLA